MPAISPQRTSNPSGYQQPISKLSSKFDKLPISDYTSNSLGKPRGSSPSRFNYLSLTYTNKSYKDGRHYDTNATSSRIGVSSYNNRFNHSISSLDRANSIQRERNSIIIDNNDSIDNTVYKTLLKKYSNTLQSKPPLIGGNRNCSLSQSRTNNNQHRHNNTKLNSTNNDQFNTQLSKSSSFDHVFNYSKKSDHNSKDFNNFEHNQLSSSSLARYVATSGSELYNKYSPAHYIPKCELSRSRSLSEATTTPSSLPTSLNNLISNDKYKNTNISNGNVSEQKLYLNNNDNNSSSSNDQQQLENCLLDDSVTLRDLKISSNNSSTTSSTRDTTDLNSSQLTNHKSRYYTSRSARPPASPTALQWERDSHKSSLTSNRNLSNDNESSYLKNNYSSYATQNSSSDEPIDGLRGLRNIGNTCFMNSVIQCLSHTTELTNFLKSQTNISTSTKDEKILYEFATLIREMWTSNAHSVAPRDLKNAFSSKHRMYSGYNQQDAQEFLRFFLDSLHCALNTGTKGHQLNIDESLSDNKKADLTWEWYSRIENSVIKNLFVGQFKSTLTCTNCGNTSATFDPFWDLSVPLPSSSRCKLDACFEYFIKEEILDGDEMPTCSRCKTRRKSTKSFRIQRFPKYLVIHLKRFSETRWSKLTNIVEFPTCERGLNMGPYGANSSNTYYTLYAISNHMGSTAGGHYVALCKNPVSKQWHEFNDNDVSSIPESSLVSSSAYLLFYEKAS